MVLTARIAWQREQTLAECSAISEACLALLLLIGTLGDIGLCGTCFIQ